MALTVPNTFSSGATIASADMNANFDAIEAWGNAIPVADLADGSSAQIIVCNASGVPTYRTASGAATISNTGVVSLTYSNRPQGLDTNMAGDGTTFTALNGIQFQPTAGTYLYWATARINKGTSSALLKATLRIRDASEIVRAELSSQTDYLETISLATQPRVSAWDGSTTITVDATTTLGDAGTSVARANGGGLFMLRLA